MEDSCCSLLLGWCWHPRSWITVIHLTNYGMWPDAQKTEASQRNVNNGIIHLWDCVPWPKSSQIGMIGGWWGSDRMVDVNPCMEPFYLQTGWLFGVKVDNYSSTIGIVWEELQTLTLLSTIINYYPTSLFFVSSKKDLSVTSAVTPHQDASNKNQMWLWTEPLGLRAMNWVVSSAAMCFFSGYVCWFKIV